MPEWQRDLSARDRALLGLDEQDQVEPATQEPNESSSRSNRHRESHRWIRQIWRMV
jgi:hypothetical protein